MGIEHLLTPKDHLLNFLRVEVGPSNRLGEALHVIRLEEYQLILAEIVPDSGSIWNDHSFPHSQILENPGWHVYLGEGTAPIGNDPQVDGGKSLRNLVMRFATVIKDDFL
jgi:hypothetical protein